MAVNYAYNYAVIDVNTGMCIGVQTMSEIVTDDPRYVEIPVYDTNYMLKYYLNGAWYEDAAGTIPWTSALV